MTRKFKPFTSLSRRHRRTRVQHIKNLIYRERERCGGLHYDDCDSENAEAIAADWVWTWSDVLFLDDQDPTIYWNAEIITADVARMDIIENRVLNEATAMLDQAQLEDELRLETVSNYDAKGKIVGYKQVMRTRVAYPQFGGMTYHDYINKRVADILRDTPPVITPGYSIQHGYRSGIGLQIIVAEAELTREVIDNAIRTFLAGNMPSLKSI
ncbi:hypothetical protein [Pantoea vagans]|uniref:hypothetical protein n=1 Tax=Pantoea vagans TaxID=470934 RepID=UPI00050EA496|nr:hypothetical protein [Pantoea vagans]KGD78829.1 hypothetical protein ID11_01475 [Pantoea vagans]